MYSLRRAHDSWLVIQRRDGREIIIRRCDSWSEANSALKHGDFRSPPETRYLRDSQSEWDSMYDDQRAQRREFVRVSPRDIYGEEED